MLCASLIPQKRRGQDRIGHAKYLLEEPFVKDKKGGSSSSWEELRNHDAGLTLVKERKEGLSRKSLILQ